MKMILSKQSVITVSLAVIVALLAILYITGSYPALMVGGRFISADHERKNLDTARRLEPSIADGEATDQLIKTFKRADLLADLNISFTQQMVDDELNYLIVDKGTSYLELLNRYFEGNEDKFKEMVVVPQVYNALLRTKYNSDFAPAASFSKAQTAINELNQGKSFEEIAKAQSEDRATAVLGGDMGFLKMNQILPELWPAIEKSALGQVNKQIVTSRLGHHIIYPVETAEQNGKKTWHIKHIFFEAEGYEQWLEAKLEKIRVWRILGS